MEKQEGETPANQGRGSCIEADPKEQAERKDVQQVRRSIHRHVHGKTRSMSTPDTRWGRGAIFLEQRYVAKILCLGSCVRATGGMITEGARRVVFPVVRFFVIS